jgi:peptide/nickel transport system substrate-binding protein
MRTTRRRFIQGIAAGGAGLALASCVGGAPSASPGATTSNAAAVKPKAGGNLVVGNLFDIGNIDPTTSTGASGSFFELQTHDRLLGTDRNLKIIPGLAERWTVAPDQKSVTLFLRKGVTFHDGSPWDAATAKWNLDRNITHAKSVHKAALAPIDKVEVVDDSTIRLVLKDAYAPLLAQLTTQAGFMSSRKEVEAQGDTFGSKVHKGGSGPFMYQEIVTNDHVTLVKNPNWWGRDEFGQQLPYVDRVTIRIIPDNSVLLTNLRTGSVNAMYEPLRADIGLAKSESSLVVKSVPTTTFLVLIPNQKSGMVFSERRYVKAVSMAIDRAEILKVAYEGTGDVGYGPISPRHFAFDPDFKPYEKPDVEGAKKLVQEVGKGPLSFEIMYTTGDQARLQALQLVQSQLKKADINVTLRGLASAASTAEFNAASYPGMNANSVGTGNLDPEVRIYDFAHSKGRLNRAGYSDPEVDRLLDGQRLTFDEKVRTDLLRRAQKIAVVDHPAHIWYQFPHAFIIHTKDVKGLEPDPVDRPSFATAWFDK